MLKYLKERILSSLVIGVILFMIMCIAHKVIVPRPDWLSFSLIWTISWVIGFFVSKSLATLNLGIGRTILIEILIILLVLIVVLFFLAVVFEIPDFAEYTFDIVFSFGLSIILNNKL